MSTPTNSAQPTTAAAAETKTNDKEINFRMQEKAMREKYEKELSQERAARLESERKIQELMKKNISQDDDDDHNEEPYVDDKRLNKKLAKFGEKTKQQTQTDIQEAVQKALHEERKNNWIRQNSDFYEVMQQAEKLYLKDPELADTILEMPDGFERQKLVYKNIKALGLHKPEEKKPNIQDKIDANRRSPFYQPSGVGAAPYASEANFSPSGQKESYNKMQELKNRLRLG